MSEPRSYHGQPVLKQPTWTWEIPCYFFTGGLGGASAALAYLCELRGEEILARRAWAAATGALAVSPLLLISDLGRPARFLNMLRMFKVTSPMSVGSWILTVSATSTVIAGGHSWLRLFPRLSRFAGPLAAVSGLPLSTYTAALLANTAVPVWHESRRLLPFLFGAGASLSAGAMALILTPVQEASSARRLAIGAAVTEVAVKELMERRLGEHRKAYQDGLAGTFGHVSRGCLLAGGGILAARGTQSRAAAASAGALLLAGALSARWSVFKAGFNSVADPAFVIGPQRSRIEHGARRGAARTKPARAPAKAVDGG